MTFLTGRDFLPCAPPGPVIKVGKLLTTNHRKFYIMSRIPRIEFEGAAAMTYVRFLSKALIEKGIFTTAEIVDLLNTAAERHQEAAKSTLSNANADAAVTLREAACEIADILPG